MTRDTLETLLYLWTRVADVEVLDLERYIAERLPRHGRARKYSDADRLEAVRLALDGGLSWLK